MYWLDYYTRLFWSEKPVANNLLTVGLFNQSHCRAYLWRDKFVVHWVYESPSSSTYFKVNTILVLPNAITEMNDISYI